MPLAFFNNKWYWPFRVRRHTTSEMPTLKEGEPAFDTTAEELLIGGASGNRIAGGPPIGSSIFWLMDTPPSHYLECNGAAISRTTYSRLYSVIGTRFGAGDGSTTFNLPGARGRFIRIWDHGAGVDPDAASRTDRGDGTGGDANGSLQADAFKSHVHPYGTITVSNVNQNTTGGGVPHPTGAGAANTAATGGSETRPININMMLCIRYE